MISNISSDVRYGFFPVVELEPEMLFLYDIIKVIGIISNFFAIVLTTRSNLLKKPTSLYLLNLALVDLSILFFFCPAQEIF